MDKMEINEKDLRKIEQEEKGNTDIYINKSENKFRKDKRKSYTIKPHKLHFNLNSKYDNALLEELYNPNDKSWRDDIIKASPEKDNNTQKEENKEKKIMPNNLFLDKKLSMDINNINKINKNEIIEDNNKDKNDNNKNEERFRDFDEILFLEDTKDKKRKYSSAQKLVTIDKLIKIPKPIEKNKSDDVNEKKLKNSFNNNNNNTNLDIIQETPEKEEKKRNEFMKENRENEENKEIEENKEDNKENEEEEKEEKEENEEKGENKEKEENKENK